MTECEQQIKAIEALLLSATFKGGVVAFGDLQLIEGKTVFAILANLKDGLIKQRSTLESIPGITEATASALRAVAGNNRTEAELALGLALNEIRHANQATLSLLSIKD